LFLFYIEYRKLSRGVTFFMRVNFLGEILSSLSVLFPSSWGYASYRYNWYIISRQQLQQSVTLLLWKFIVRSFCQQSPHSFINTVLQVIVYTAIFYNSKTKFPLIMFIKFDLNSNCIFSDDFWCLVTSFIWLHLHRLFVTWQFT